MVEETTTSEAVATAPRKITIVSTVGEKKKTIEFEGNKWKDLKKALQDSYGYNLNNMKCVESVNRHTLEHPDADLPTRDFNLFLMPGRSKSGGERSEVYARIKQHIERDGDSAKNHFSRNGNYTQVGTETLKQLLEEYEGGSTSSISKEVKEKKSKKDKNKAEAVADVAEVVSTSSNKKETLLKEFKTMSLDDKLFFVASVLMDIKDAIGGVKTSEAKKEETEEEKAQREQKEKEQKEKEEREAKEKQEREEKARKEREERERKAKEEDEALDEMENLMDGFDDVDKGKVRNARGRY